MLNVLRLVVVVIAVDGEVVVGVVVVGVVVVAVVVAEVIVVGEVEVVVVVIVVLGFNDVLMRVEKMAEMGVALCCRA